MPGDAAGWPVPLALLCVLLSRRSCGEEQRAHELASRLDEPGWQAFADLAIGRHRVAPSVVEAIAAEGVAVPGPVLGRLREEARASGFAALAQRAESLRLASALSARGIRAIWLKGWPLAEQLYGAPGMRHASDIDILVAPDQRTEAAACLVAAGYLAEESDALRARLIAHPAVGAECKDVQYGHPESGLVVELHWRTNHFRAWPDLRDLGEAPVTLAGGAAQILVPGPLGQLVYLSCHGQQHVFSRLKWLLDIARLAEHRGADALDTELARAEAAGAGVPVRLALHLAGRVFDAPVPERVRSLAGREGTWAAEIVETISDPRAAPGLLRTRLDFYRWHWRMAEGMGQRAGVLRDLLWRRLRLRLAGLTGGEMRGRGMSDGAA